MLFSADSSWTLVFWSKDPCNKTNGALKKNRRLLKKRENKPALAIVRSFIFRCPFFCYSVIWHHLILFGIIWYHLVSSGIIWYYLVSSGIIWYHLVSGIIISPSSGVWGWSTPAALAMSSLSRNSANIEFLKFCGFLYLTFWYFARTVRMVSFCFVKKCNKQTLWHPFTHHPPPPPQVIEPHQEKLIRNKPNLTAREFVTVDPECDRMIGCTELA